MENIGRREVAEVEIVALQGDELGALLEQRVVPVRLEIEIVLDGGGERLVGLGAHIGFGEGRAEFSPFPPPPCPFPGTPERGPPQTAGGRLILNPFFPPLLFPLLGPFFFPKNLNKGG